jgi:hypothetical protein
MPLTYTSEQVINNAAGNLGKWVPGEALGAVEHDTISDALDAVLSEISKIIAINDRDEIPDFTFEVISNLTGVFAAASFSNTQLDYDNQVLPLERRLRYLVAQSPTYEPLRSYYF